MAVNLEAELSCSICTELLYQPLTLLDCLHTFCGACLSEWFRWQRLNAEAQQDDLPHGAPPVVYTCPTCRAGVRDTKSDAKINSLLALLLQSDPSKGRSDDEKAMLAVAYKPGDVVLAPLTSRGDTTTHDWTNEPRRETDWESTARAGSNGGRQEQEDTAASASSLTSLLEGPTALQRPENFPNPPDRNQRRDEADARVDNSATDLEPVSERDVWRLAWEEGLLAGIDQQQLTPADEVALASRLAAAFQQRMTLGRPLGSRSEDDQDARHGMLRNALSSRRRRPVYEPPPLARVWRSTESTRLRSAARVRSPSRSMVAAAHSAPARDTSRQPTRRHLPGVNDVSTGLLDGATSHRTRHASRGGHHRAQSERPERSSRRDTASETRVASTQGRTESGQSLSPRPRLLSVSPPATPRSAPQDLARHDVHDRRHLRLATALDPVAANAWLDPDSAVSHTGISLPPSLTCANCNQPGIQLEVHHICNQCHDSAWAICNRCFILGIGCRLRMGLVAYGSQGRSHVMFDGAESHMMVTRRWVRPQAETSDDADLATSLRGVQCQQGAFCQSCQAFADDCYWKCGRCNDGTWGYCSRCVNQGKCCTHPLLPLARVPEPAHPRGRATHDDYTRLGPNELYRPMTVRTFCNSCTKEIAAEDLRFHCPRCRLGDYDMCYECYVRLCSDASHRVEGWRRCPQGHRMAVVTYWRGRGKARRRFIVMDLIGGHALRDEDIDRYASDPALPESRGTWSWYEASTPSGHEHRSKLLQPRLARFGTCMDASLAGTPIAEDQCPPSGGVGLRVRALWPYVPVAAHADEICFPRGAEITEAENINDDWFWGCYAGQRGLFPGTGYVEVIDSMTGVN